MFERRFAVWQGFAMKLSTSFYKQDKIQESGVNYSYEKGGGGWNSDLLFGWQFGYNENSTGAVRVYPVGISADYLSITDETIYTTSYFPYYQTYDYGWGGFLLSYKAKAEYQKNNLFDTGLYGIFDLGYKKTFSNTNSNYKDFKPSGYEVGAEIGYQIIAGLTLGARVSLEKQKVQGFDFINSKTYQAVIGYRF